MTQPGRPGVVLDCMVFLQASSRPAGPAARLFIDFVEAGHVTLSVSDPILAEVRDVLGRPRIRAKNPAITDESVEDFFRRIDRVAQKIDEVPAHTPFPAIRTTSRISISPSPRTPITWLPGTTTCST